MDDEAGHRACSRADGLLTGGLIYPSIQELTKGYPWLKKIINFKPLPKSIKFPFEENYEIQNAEINNFSLVGNPAYSCFESYYSTPLIEGDSRVYMSWYIASPTPGFKLLKFPLELTDVYRSPDIEAFEFGAATFFSGLSYKDWIGRRYDGKSEEEYEQYTVTVYK